MAELDYNVGQGDEAEGPAFFFEAGFEGGFELEGDGFGLQAQLVDLEAADLLVEFFEHAFVAANDGFEPGGFFLDLLFVTGVGDEEEAVGGEQDVGVVAFEAGEPGDVDEAGDQKGLARPALEEAGGFEGGTDAVDPGADVGLGFEGGLFGHKAPAAGSIDSGRV